jgi:Tfp pilus assembly protein PilW
MTLVELMAALAIAGLLLVTGRSVLDQIGRASATLGRAARAADERANSARALRAVVRRADVRPDSLDRFSGDSVSATFRSFCEVAGGWLVPCAVTLVLDARPDSSALSARLSTGGSLSLEPRAGAGTLRYLDVGVSPQTWVGQWGRSIVPPAAVAMIIAGDTIVLPMAGR